MFRCARRVASLKPTAVNAILAEVRALAGQGAKPVSLMRGEPDFRTPEHIVQVAIDSLHRGRTSYPDNRGEMVLREAVGDRLGYDPAAEILITDGATLGIYAALMACLDPEERNSNIVLLPDPIYDAYHSPISLAGGFAERFSFEDPESSAHSGAKILLLNTPWNPVGHVFTRDELRLIGEFCIRHDLILISDEIYEKITYGDHRHISPVEAMSELRDRCVIVNSFSKTYAMTGWRLGYCAGPKNVIQAMFMVLAQSSRGPATFIQDAGAAALRGPQDCVEEMRREYECRRQLVLEKLSGIPRVRVIPPDGGFFAMVDIRETGLTSDDARQRLLHEFGVVVIHGSAYGPGGEGLLRVSFASGGENLNRGLDLLRTGLSLLESKSR